jgi:2-polyprenyl-3-methyl-5-hydroxy-6-metoxy-1,4-benzoquinol methylase
MYTFEWILGGLARPEYADELAAFYSMHYGVWGDGSGRDGHPVKVTPAMVRALLKSADSRIAVARFDDELVGYAIALQTKVPHYGMVSWVTQLVVHENHRRNNVGKTLLFTIWGFSNHRSWGLVSANPYAIRALEKATRRRCLPSRTKRNREILLRLGTKEIPYITESTELRITNEESRINTAFFLDHSSIPERLAAVVTKNKPWVLGDLPLGWEWFAFTFHDQQQIGLTQAELDQMLQASDEVTKRAYSRMLLNGGEHAWAKHAPAEIDFLLTKCLNGKPTCVVDFGCGRGRHVLELASRGIDATGLDYIDAFVSAARQQAVEHGLSHASFEVADCRTAKLEKEFDAGICLYDVIGSYANQTENLKLLQNLARHVMRGGFILLSVMNMEFTERRAKHWFSVASEPDRLLNLPPSHKMETTGEVFDPEHYMIDRDTRIVYRKEQFEAGSSLPQELLVRDRRYTGDEIEVLCRESGLDVVWCRFVKSGAWDQSLPVEDAKEVLVLCRKP